MIDNKYIVFKRTEFLSSMYVQSGKTLPQPVADAVVIRRQDVFAAPALDAYANCIIAAVETLKAHGCERNEAKRLQEIADYFHAQASLAWQINRKLPD